MLLFWKSNKGAGIITGVVTCQSSSIKSEGSGGGAAPMQLPAPSPFATTRGASGGGCALGGTSLDGLSPMMRKMGGRE